MTDNQRVTLAIIHQKLCSLEKQIEDNKEEIKVLSEQVAMGRGGLRAIFVFGALIGAVFTAFKIIKDMM